MPPDLPRRNGNIEAIYDERNKKKEQPWRTNWFRDGAENIQDEPEASCGTRQQEGIKNK